VRQKFYLSIISTVVLLSACFFTASAQTTQKKITSRPYAWYTYAASFQLAPKWLLSNDISERHFIDNGKQLQFTLRSKINYTLGQNWNAGIGFAYFLSNTFDPASTSTLGVPELRVFQEFNNNQKLNRFTISHRYRIEERYFRKVVNDKLASGYNFNFRFRYKFEVEYRIYQSTNNTQLLSFKAGDEIMLNAGKKIVKNMFEQNRINTAISYQANNNFTFDLGYTYGFQQKSSGDYNQANIFRFSILHKIKI
jgi:opacity protein-like surface antigen